MAPSGISPFLAVRGMCTENQCLSQVLAQREVCNSIFGLPTTTTVTIPAETVLSTTTLTVPYTDIIVSVSTTYSTDYSTSTSYTEVLEMVTEYSSTKTWTVSETVTLAPEPASNRALKRRGKCGGPKTSSTSSILTTSSAVSYPVPSHCPGVKEYSSACSCIGAVSSTATVTALAEEATSVVTVTDSTTVQATAPATVVTVVVSTTVIEPATSTITSTITTLSETTTTVTSTVTPTPTVTWPIYPVSDPGFEQQTNWLPTRNIEFLRVTGAHGGSYVAALSNKIHQQAILDQDLTGMKPGGRYRVQIWARAEVVGAGCSLVLWFNDRKIVLSFGVPAPGDWKSYEGTYTHEGTATTAGIKFVQTCQLFGGTSVTWVDDVVLTLLD